MIILRFGRTGRMAEICLAVIRITHPKCLSVFADRKGGFCLEDGFLEYDNLEAVLKAHPNEAFLVLDASVDHRSTGQLISHENFKRECISMLQKNGRLWRCVGFSSGIATIDAIRVRPSARHMLEYRRQKIFQEELFAELECPVFLPQLFTLVGPRTYTGRTSAWAQILSSRLARAKDVVLNEPQARKAWVSEFEVFRHLLRFLVSEQPINVTGPLVQGNLTLHEIASGEQIPILAIKYTTGTEEGWLDGDYVPNILPTPSQDVSNELLRAITIL